MTRTFQVKNIVLASLIVVSLTAPTARAAGAADILKDSGVAGGLVVHVGCGEGKLTSALRAGDAYVVHGLDTNAANVAAAREHARSLGLAGKVAFDRFDGKNLPYVDGTVNLVVSERANAVSQAEIMRVLAPGGVAMVGGSWRRTVKPWPGEIDEWTHYLHGPDNNAVAADTVVGPPRRLQWQAGPKWTRHHDKMSSLSAMVSAGGRIFYILDEGSTASIYMPPQWALIARDGFNGKLLWRRKINRWYNTFKGLKDGPADAPRRLIAADGKVYATLSLEGLVTCMDAVTGKTVRVYRGTKGAEEIILSDGVLLVLVGPGSIGDGKRLERPTEKRRIVALNAATGRKLWEASDVVAALTMAADAKGVYYFNFATKRAVALDRKSGRKVWTSADALPTPTAQKSFFASKLVVSDGVVLLASGEYSGMIKSGGGANKADTLTAMSAATGKTLWQGKHPPSGYSSPENVFVIEGIVWCDASSNTGLTGGLTGFDLKTGRVKYDFQTDKTSYWFHHRCHPGRATVNYVITSRTGSEFIDFRKKTWDLNHWTRGACLYGLMPCNGLLYVPPAPCACYAEAKSSKTPNAGPQLTKGPAFGKVNPQSEIPGPGGRNPQSDWPTYRGDNSRSGATNAPVPAKLRPGWKADLGQAPPGLEGGPRDEAQRRHRRGRQAVRGGCGRAYGSRSERAKRQGVVALHGRRTRGFAADVLCRYGAVRLGGRASVLPSRRRRRVGVAVPGGGGRSSNPRLRAGRVALAGAREHSRPRRRGLLRRRPVGLRRRRDAAVPPEREERRRDLPDRAQREEPQDGREHPGHRQVAEHGRRATGRAEQRRQAHLHAVPGVRSGGQAAGDWPDAQGPPRGNAAGRRANAPVLPHRLPRRQLVPPVVLDVRQDVVQRVERVLRGGQARAGGQDNLRGRRQGLRIRPAAAVLPLDRPAGVPSVRVEQGMEGRPAQGPRRACSQAPREEERRQEAPTRARGPGPRHEQGQLRLDDRRADPRPRDGACGPRQPKNVIHRRPRRRAGRERLGQAGRGQQPADRQAARRPARQGRRDPLGRVRQQRRETRPIHPRRPTRLRLPRRRGRQPVHDDDRRKGRLSDRRELTPVSTFSPPEADRRRTPRAVPRGPKSRECPMCTERKRGEQVYPALPGSPAERCVRCLCTIRRGRIVARAHSRTSASSPMRCPRRTPGVFTGGEMGVARQTYCSHRTKTRRAMLPPSAD